MKQISVLVTNIQLDPANPRVAWMVNGNHTTHDLFEQYWAYEDILEIVKSIDSSGLYPHEQILVVEHEPNKKYTVLEGNRRIVAIRSILDPSLAPQKRRDYLESVKEKRRSEIERVGAWASGSRDEILPIIIRKHASSDTSSWESLMKARVYWDFHAAHRGTLSFDEMAKALLVTKSEFQDHYRDYLLYTYVKGIAKFTPEERDLVANERRFPISTLVRIVKVISVREELGLLESWELDPSKKVLFDAHVYPITLDLIYKRQDSRTLENNEKVAAYFATIKAAVGTSDRSDPGVSGGSSGSSGGGSSGSGSGGPGVADVPGAHQQGPRVRSRRERKSFFQSKVHYRVPGNDAFKRLFETLDSNKKVVPEDDAIACGILIRSFLDKGTRVLYERKGIVTITQQQTSGPGGAKVAVQVQVSDSKVKFYELIELARSTHAGTLGVDSGIADSLKWFINGVGNSAMLEKLNSLVHKPAGDVSSAELRALWPRIEKYVRLLVEVV